MSRNKNARKVSYFVKRDRNTGSYYVFVDGYKHPILIQKKPAGWYACSQYHKHFVMQSSMQRMGSDYDNKSASKRDSPQGWSQR